RILIATTVIEVGVDVPDATIMVIEHAERFGLAQLHQLRGRVGRGEKPSSCVLLYKDPLGETATRRLSVMRETEDGFRIAEEDLK
ncbi:MAG: ATP-dependent DNA helicase RecG, partial [Mesorhizobium sp.]